MVATKTVSAGLRDDGSGGYAVNAAGSSGQVQYNASGAFAGMAGTVWTPTTQRLSITGLTGADGTATLSLTKVASSSSVLDLFFDGSAKAMRFFGPPDVASLTPVSYVGNGGNWATRAWMTINGTSTGTGDGYSIPEVTSDPYMLGIGADVQTAVQISSYNGAAGRTIVALDHTRKYVWSIEEFGNLCWAGSASTYVMDTGLSRLGAATLGIGNGTAGDFTGNLKLAALTMSANLNMANNTGVLIKDSGGTLRNALTLDSGDNLILGTSSIPNNMVFVPGTGKQFRLLNAAQSAYIMAASESNRNIGFGSNTFDSIWTFYDSTATTGDSVMSIRDGAARAARVRFGTGGTYDVGFARNAAGVLAVTDASTTFTNFRDLRVRSIIQQPPASVTPGSNGDLVVEATSNTTLTFKLKGTDGTVRTGTLTLA